MTLEKKLPVGIVTEEDHELEKPLLSPVYYIKKILTNSNLTLYFVLTKILEKKVSVIFLPSNKKNYQN